jgi:hypothetical protein
MGELLTFINLSHSLPLKKGKILIKESLNIFTS